MKFRRMLTAGALLAGSLVSVAVTAAPAHAAAYPTCNGATEVKASSPKGIVAVQLPTYNGNPDCTLRRGNYDNWGVVALQLALRDCNGAKSLAVDGDYGADTEAVVTWIQAASGITADGVYGPNTRGVVKWKTSAGCLNKVKP